MDVIPYRDPEKPPFVPGDKVIGRNTDRKEVIPGKMYTVISTNFDGEEWYVRVSGFSAMMYAGRFDKLGPKIKRNLPDWF